MAKVTHETWFEIAAKLMPSFAGAINTAKTKFNDLGKTAQTVGKQFANVRKWILGVAAGAVAAIAAFGIGAVLKKAFGGAIDAAKNYLIQNQQIESVLAANMRRHKISEPLIRANTEALKASTEELGKQGVLGAGIYRESLRTLGTYGRSPQEIAKLMPIMGDVLVATKGINASTEQMGELSTAVGKAIQGGPLRALGQYGVDISKITAKQWKQMSVQERINWLTKQWGAFAGENARQVESDLGALRKMENATGSLSRKIGLELLPVQAALARLWTENLPAIEPIVTGVMNKVGQAIKGVADWARTEGIPAAKQYFAELAARPEVQQGWAKLGDAMNRIGAVIGPVLLPFLQKIGAALGSWAVDVAVRALEGLADALQEVAGFVEWISDFENVAKALDKFGESLQSSLKGIPVIGEVIPEDYGQKVADNLKSTWADLGEFVRDPVGKISTEWAQLEADLGAIVEGVKEKFSGIWEAITTFDLGAALGPIVEEVKNCFQQAWDGAKQVWADVSGIFSGVVSAIGSALSGVTDAIKAPFVAAIEAITTAWNNLVSLITGFDIGAVVSKITGGFGKAWENRPTWMGGKGAQAAAPATQAGGIFSAPQVRTIAEAGPEAVIPLERSGRAQGLLARAAGAIGGGGGMRGGGGATMNFAPVINFNGAATPEAVGQVQANLRRLADEFMSRLGEFEDRERRLAFQ